MSKNESRHVYSYKLFVLNNIYDFCCMIVYLGKAREHDTFSNYRDDW